MLEKIIKKFNRTLAIALSSAVIFSGVPKQVSAQNVATKFIGANGVLQGAVAGYSGWKNGCGFWKSAAKGFVGGSLDGIAKVCVGKDLSCAWPAKFTGALGSSIVYDAANCNGPGTSFSMDYGPLFLEWKKDRGIKPYILPDSLGVELFLLSNDSVLDFENSVKYGTPIFYKSDEGFLKGINGLAITALVKP